MTVILTMVSVSSVVNAQREKNNIYLFDCTGSMKTNGLWQPAQAALDATITTQTKIGGSQFLVIPFGDKPYETFKFNSSEYPKVQNNITKAFDNYVTQAKYTRLTDVLEEGFKKVDSNKDNRIYLLTDGEPNGGDNPEKVAKTITEWCANHRNCRLFYVALINGVINPVIRSAIDACPDAFIVQCQDKVIPQITDISSEVYTSLSETAEKKKVAFSMPGEYQLNISSTDSLFNVQADGNRAYDGRILLTISPKKPHDIQSLHHILNGDEYSFPVNIQCVDNRFFIANPQLTVHVSDKLPKKLTLVDGNDELKSSGIDWYDSFLWSQAAPVAETEWNLAPLFENQLNGTSIKMKFQASGNGDDFDATFNGQPIRNGDVLTVAPGNNAVIRLSFQNDAETGKRYFNLTPEEYSDLDIINELPADQYAGTSLRTEYNVRWNPLKTTLFWIGIALLTLLVLWFIILKPILYPTIKLVKAEMIGPGTYYASKRIKGARKIVFTSKRQSQNILSRLFTGEIRYVKADHFIPDFVILPASGKKRVKVCSGGKAMGGWDIYPSSIFTQYEKGTVENRSEMIKFQIEFN